MIYVHKWKIALYILDKQKLSAEISRYKTYFSPKQAPQKEMGDSLIANEGSIRKDTVDILPWTKCKRNGCNHMENKLNDKHNFKSLLEISMWLGYPACFVTTGVSNTQWGLQTGSLHSLLLGNQRNTATENALKTTAAILLVFCCGPVRLISFLKCFRFSSTNNGLCGNCSSFKIFWKALSSIITGGR